MKTLIKLFSIILLLAFNLQGNYKQVGPEFLIQQPQDVLTYYQLMKDVHELFEKVGITYWVIAGTLLGAVRHSGIIPWDHDLDISIFEKDITQLIKLEPQLNKLGYLMAEDPESHIWFIFAKSLHLDIIPARLTEQKVFYSIDKLNILLGKTCDQNYLHFEVNELFPLKKYKFGEIEVMGANNPHNYLRCAYGAKYLSHAAIHSLPPNQNNLILLSEDEKQPAIPTGPLEDRIKNI